MFLVSASRPHPARSKASMTLRHILFRGLMTWHVFTRDITTLVWYIQSAHFCPCHSPSCTILFLLSKGSEKDVRWADQTFSLYRFMSPWVVLRAHPVIHTMKETPHFGTMNDRARTVVHIPKSTSGIHMFSHQWIHCEKLCRQGVFPTKAFGTSFSNHRCSKDTSIDTMRPASVEPILRPAMGARWSFKTLCFKVYDSCCRLWVVIMRTLTTTCIDCFDPHDTE